MSESDETEQDREELTRDMRTMYAAGASLREIGEAYGKSYGTVHRLLARAGVVFRPRGGSSGAASRARG
ncbi:helix-turn-helix domain-containing protein [Kitasatospora sp. NPDC101155]|uniref:helix-turn-helix domain-containing protein n=1 Tax=Kitasatospora sp. NPDC101155 TaxID=3364097 RepID=UPI00382A9D2E